MHSNISFMVLAAPRSATTWISNLLTTEETLCLHDPLLEYTSQQLDRMNIPGRRLGIADTGALLWTDWLADHPAKKIVLWRDPYEVNASLRELGLPPIEPKSYQKGVLALPNVRVLPWQSMFDWPVASEICHFFGVPLDKWRFDALKKMNVQPQFSRLSVSKEAMQELVRRLAQHVL